MQASQQAQLDLYSDDSKTPQPLMQIFELWASSATGRTASSPMSAESEAVYRDMWSALVKWCVAERTDLGRISAAELDAYLLSRAGRAGRGSDLENRYAWRMLRLVELALHHHARSTGAVPSTSVAELLQARPEIRFANAADGGPLPEFLEAGEARSLVAFLAKSKQSPGTGGDWKDLRDRCAVALHLGAGLTPGEVRRLLVSNIRGLARGTRKIRVAGNATVQAHEAPVAGWAWRVLQAWSETRSALGVPGEVLLPSTRAGRAGMGQDGTFTRRSKASWLPLGFPSRGARIGSGTPLR